MDRNSASELGIAKEPATQDGRMSNDGRYDSKIMCNEIANRQRLPNVGEHGLEGGYVFVGSRVVAETIQLAP